MSRKPDTWMPLDIGAYLADTTHLTTILHGAYLLLLFAYWRLGGPLPDNDARFAAITKTTAGEWRKLRPVLADFFDVHDGHWHQRRCDAELAKARAMTEAKAQAGQKGAEKRWQNDGKRMAEPSFRHKQTDAPLPSPSPEATSLRSVAKRTRKARSALPEDFPSLTDTEKARQFWAVHNRFDLVDGLADQVAQFRDHHAGKGTLSADWPATWRTWMRNALKFNRPHTRKVSTHDKGTVGAALFLASIEGGDAAGNRDGAGEARNGLSANGHGRAQVVDLVPNVLRGPERQESGGNPLRVSIVPAQPGKQILSDSGDAA